MMVYHRKYSNLEVSLIEKFSHLCIYCNEPLSKWENIRSYCWNCSELTSPEAFHEEFDEDKNSLRL